MNIREASRKGKLIKHMKDKGYRHIIIKEKISPHFVVDALLRDKGTSLVVGRVPA